MATSNGPCVGVKLNRQAWLIGLQSTCQIQTHPKVVGCDMGFHPHPNEHATGVHDKTRIATPLVHPAFNPWRHRGTTTTHAMPPASTASFQIAFLLQCLLLLLLYAGQTEHLQSTTVRVVCTQTYCRTDCPGGCPKSCCPRTTLTTCCCCQHAAPAPAAASMLPVVLSP